MMLVQIYVYGVMIWFHIYLYFIDQIKVIYVFITSII